MRKPLTKPSARVASRRALADHLVRERVRSTGRALEGRKAGALSLRELFSAPLPR